MSEKILVTGAPGNVGTEVVKALQAQHADFRIGAFDKETAKKQLGEQLEIVPFNFLDATTYEQAFDGITKLFLVRPPALADIENEVAPALRAAKDAGVRHIVFLSLQGVENNRITPHYKIEQCILELGLNYTFLRASFFMQNLSTTHRAEIQEQHEIAVPVGKAKTSFIDVRDIAAVAAKALTENGHENQAYTLTGAEALGYDQVVEILSQQLGYPIRYKSASPLTFFWKQRQTSGKWGYALVVTALYTITRFGNAKVVTEDVKQLLGRSPISFSQFVNDHLALWQSTKTTSAAT